MFRGIANLIEYSEAYNLRTFISVGKGVYTLPVTCYYGYSAFCEDAFNKKTFGIVSKGEQGLLNVEVLTKGICYVKYSGTTIQKISELVSILTLLCGIILLVKGWKYDKVLKG